MSYKKEYRHASVAQQLHDIYSAVLGEDLIGIVVCGGAGKVGARTYQGVDVDFVVIVSEISSEVLVRLSLAQVKAREEFTASPSHTVITQQELSDLPRHYMDMDGKAVQALIEAQEQDLAGIALARVPQLSSEAIRAFSKANRYVLQALLRKIVVRADLNPTNAHKVQMAKIALIIQKMDKQAVGDFASDELWEGRAELQDVKLRPDSYDYIAVREKMLSYIEANREVREEYRIAA